MASLGWKGLKSLITANHQHFSSNQIHLKNMDFALPYTTETKISIKSDHRSPPSMSSNMNGMKMGENGLESEECSWMIMEK